MEVGENMIVLEDLFLAGQEALAKKQRLFYDIEQQPALILTDAYEGDPYSLLTALFDNALLLTEGNINKYDLQIYLYQHLVPFLEKTFPDMAFQFNENEFPSLLAIVYNEDIVAHLDIYRHTLILEPHHTYEQLCQEEVGLMNDRDNIRQERGVLDDYVRDPKKSVEGEWAKVKVSLQEKKWRQRFQADLFELDKEEEALSKLLIDNKLQRERLEESLIYYKDVQQDIIQYFQGVYHYAVETRSITYPY